MNYEKVDVSERELENLIRLHTGKIEEGLIYLDHQLQTADGRLDVLMVDSGKSLVVAELKVAEDKGMLLQGLDYYDYVSTNIEVYARLYQKHSINSKQEVRLFLIAPSFSQILINRCKWINPQPSLFTFNCLKIDVADEIIPIFSEQSIPTPPVPPDEYTIQGHLDFIKDDKIRSQATAFLAEIETWSSNITQKAIIWGISIKVNFKVFAYLIPRRKAYVIETYNENDARKDYPIRSDDDLAKVKEIVRAAMERKMK